VVKIQQRTFFAGRQHQHSLSQHQSVSNQWRSRSVGLASESAVSGRAALEYPASTTHPPTRTAETRDRLLALLVRALSPTCDCVCEKCCVCVARAKLRSARPKEQGEFLLFYLSLVSYGSGFIWCGTPRKCASHHTLIGSVGLNISTGISWMFYMEGGTVEI
jgi:hypothetical protein